MKSSSIFLLAFVCITLFFSTSVNAACGDFNTCSDCTNIPTGCAWCQSPTGSTSCTTSSYCSSNGKKITCPSNVVDDGICGGCAFGVAAFFVLLVFAALTCYMTYTRYSKNIAEVKRAENAARELDLDVAVPQNTFAPPFSPFGAHLLKYDAFRSLAYFFIFVCLALITTALAVNIWSVDNDTFSASLYYGVNKVRDSKSNSGNTISYCDVAKAYQILSKSNNDGLSKGQQFRCNIISASSVFTYIFGALSLVGYLSLFFLLARISFDPSPAAAATGQAAHIFYVLTTVSWFFAQNALLIYAFGAHTIAYNDLSDDKLVLSTSWWILLIACIFAICLTFYTRQKLYYGFGNAPPGQGQQQLQQPVVYVQPQQPQPYGQPPYGQPPQPYGQPPYGQQPYNPYGPPAPPPAGGGVVSPNQVQVYHGQAFSMAQEGQPPMGPPPNYQASVAYPPPAANTVASFPEVQKPGTTAAADSSSSSSFDQQWEPPTKPRN